MKDNYYKPNWIFAEDAFVKFPELSLVNQAHFVDPKKIVKNIIKNAPIIKQAYASGRSEGKKEGYSDASFEYEKKLLKQAEEFENQKLNISDNLEEYRKLLDAYEKIISKQEDTISELSQENLEILSKIKDQYSKLKLLKLD